MIKNVIFDLGKVLIDTNPSEYLRKYGYDEEKYQALFDAVWTDSLWADMDVAKYESFKDIVEIYVSKHKELETELRIFFNEDWMALYTQFDDTVEFYNELCDAGYNIYLLTNFSKDGYDYISRKFDFFKKAKGSVVSSQVKMVKPNPEIYKCLLEKYNLIPEECVFIDDSVANIKTANELGICGIVYSDCDKLRKDFNEVVLNGANAIIESIKNKYLSNNKEDVLKHVEDVADIAVALAKIYDLDVARIKLAALLHDISAVMTPQEMYDFAIVQGLEIDPAEEKYHALLHQRISKIIAQEEYGITDSFILNAIECHTTLKKNASIYDKVIFIADKTSWDAKRTPALECLKDKAEQSLDEACCFYIKYQFDNKLLVMPHQWLIEAYDELRG